ncbi:methylecgonone reductase-like [Rhodamnia argentea]|uniref:Methylecgonone reductase-like n=1 Tax=Rhodamnia argentea TaxID=178133 RepID=A0ABM3HRY7_9MYRT|nr:methylecgonone reductase-like [Rhodamnia argentea]
MEECSKLGLAKSIGVSNIGTKKLSDLLLHATIPPAVNRVEMNAAWQQEKLRGYCREKGIQVSAWSPLRATGAAWGSLAVMESPVLKEVALISSASILQIALRWIYEQGACVIVKSFEKERMKENLQILEWGLSEEDSENIELQIPQKRGCASDMSIFEEGPYRSLDELWDGDA